MSTTTTPTILTIAGSDTYGGAGLQIDLKTIHHLGGYALSATTALTSQNSTGVKDVFSVPSEVVERQLNVLLEDIQVDAVKIGMLANKDIIEVLVKTIDKFQLKNIVLDTVLVSSSGKDLLESNAINMMKEELFPRVDLITPNIPEVHSLLRNTSYTGKKEEVQSTAKQFFDLGVNAVLLKGGHAQKTDSVIDYLIERPDSISTHTTKRVETTHTHGTGCLLSSAIATNLALGHTLEKSVFLSKEFIYNSLYDSSRLNLNYTRENKRRKEPIF
ncbi:MAG: bifunctional hydroxymethylpyrimidine kinase/phosphomethylpyrimidine kinase [Sulfurovum sp.]|jgi:hydroxymethylpyrimidine/phosphomethylpyrimidine kinase|uniref:bifunctional hydroxymethylpyrimidine kinase/phosphomethylpyrimidine kinase n=1 Tax=Sulfurovum sp. TaxID=1969726 RepID=UPI003C72740E